MRIGLIVPGFSAHEGDWCIPAHLNLVRRLSRHVDLRVFPLRYPHHCGAYTVFGATVQPQGGGDARRWGRLALLQRAIATLVIAHRRRPFDVLHAIWIDEPGFVAVAAGLLLRVPTVLSLAGGELVALQDIGYGGQLSRMNRWLVRIGLRRATYLTAGSSYLCALVPAQVPANRLLLIPIGVETEMFSPQGRPSSDLTSPPSSPGHPDEDVRLLHAASLVPVKDHATLLRAMPAVMRYVPRVHLHLLGDGPLRSALEAYAASLEIRNKLTFHGRVPYEQMPAYYRAADLCILSSRHEAQGLVALEAAACGRVTVGTAVGVLLDLMPEAYVAPVGDERALADVLVRTLQRPQTLAALGRASLEAVQARYTLQQTVAAFLELYRNLAE